MTGRTTRAERLELPDECAAGRRSTAPHAPWRRQWRRATRRSAGASRTHELVGVETHRHPRNVGGNARQTLVHRFNGAVARRLPRHDDQRRPPQRLERLPPRSGRQAIERQASSDPRSPARCPPCVGRADAETRRRARPCPRLVCAASITADARSAPTTTGICGIEHAMNERLVVSVPAQHDRRMRAAIRQPARDPRGDRRLSGAADRRLPTLTAGIGVACAGSHPASYRMSRAPTIPPNTRSAGARARAQHGRGSVVAIPHALDESVGQPLARCSASVHRLAETSCLRRAHRGRRSSRRSVRSP